MSRLNEVNCNELQNQLILARKEINNLRQQLTSLKHVHQKECAYIYDKLKTWQCLQCKNKENVAQNSQEVASRSIDFQFQSNYIGTISSTFPEKRGTPRQPGICSDEIGKLTLNTSIFTNPAHSLEGLQEFSHLWVLFHFHKNDSTHIRAKVAPPRLNGIRTGVFATRSPHRPGPIGLSLVKIMSIMENVIYFSGVDMVDQTPVLDIKPYIPQYDNPGLANTFYPEESLFLDTHSDGNLVASTSTSGLVPSLDGLNINRQLDGEENQRRDLALGAATNDRVAHNNTEENFYARSTSRIGEREAPDGEEEESPTVTSSSTTVATPSPAVVRVPAWIDQSPVSVLSVTFKDHALLQLSQLGVEGEGKKTTITNVLKEDPRSVYLRERWGSQNYVFRIAELYVSCKFNDESHSVTVYQVFQNEVAEADD